MTEQPRKIGRPKKAPAELRTERLAGIRLTAAERQHVDELAERAGLDVMEFCRRAILGQRIAQPRPKADGGTFRELNRIGVNLNQIAARVNMTGDLAEDFRAVVAELRAALEKVAGHGS